MVLNRVRIKKKKQYCVSLLRRIHMKEIIYPIHYRNVINAPKDGRNVEYLIVENINKAKVKIHQLRGLH